MKENNLKKESINCKEKVKLLKKSIEDYKYNSANN
jgi:hypothetical protein